MMGGAYEDGEETKSDFLARMIMMGRVEIDEKNMTLLSTTTCKEETGETKPMKMLPVEDNIKKGEAIKNPILPCDKAKEAGCEQYSVVAKGFMSMYTEKMEGKVMDGAWNLVLEAANCKDISFEPDGPSVKNAANFLAEEWHHKYDVKFKVAATQDPKEYLSNYFDENIKQLGDAAIKISYVQTDKV
eukprot:GFUD01020924.1.p1 GENE.GFUD01020924.1~~GFUD01020924.1.p1  ORF type:complete len:187 (+),score=67.70 GFUD01020924.1:134-694(+)